MPSNAEQRRAAAGVSPIGGPSVTPNATKDAEWRAQVGKAYFEGGEASADDGRQWARGVAQSLTRTITQNLVT